MGFCKICQKCGHLISFPKRINAPDNCPGCGQWLGNYQMYSDDDPRIEEELGKWGQMPEGKPEPRLLTVQLRNGEELTVPPEGCADCPHAGKWLDLCAAAAAKQAEPEGYVLRLADGQRIPIPQGGCVIGRTETGAEALAACPAVSRQHLRIIPRSHGVLLEDLSRYGTSVDGVRIQKTLAQRGCRITLGDVEATLE